MKNQINYQTFCVAPFVHQSLKTDGSIKACCRSLPRITSIQKDSLISAWNHKTLKQLRLDAISGQVNSLCNICFDQEKKNVKSLRQNYNSSERNYREAVRRAENMDKDGYLDQSPTWIEFKLSNLCNLKCRMCHPLDSTQWFNDYKLVKHLREPNWRNYLSMFGVDQKPLLSVFDEKFYDDVNLFLKKAFYLQFAGGEPLYDLAHYKILERAKSRAKEIRLGYATNLTVLSIKDHNVLDYWKNFRGVTVQVSIDGPPELNNYIRGGSERYNIEKNIEKVKKLSNTVIVCKPTIQALNILYLPELIKWSKKNKFDLMNYHFVKFPEFLDCRIWTGDARERITKKLENSLKKESNKRYIIILKNVLSYFKSSETYDEKKWKTFLEYNRILDKARNQSWTDHEFLREYMK